MRAHTYTHNRNLCLSPRTPGTSQTSSSQQQQQQQQQQPMDVDEAAATTTPGVAQPAGLTQQPQGDGGACFDEADCLVSMRSRSVLGLLWCCT
jgi:hypothetical protein